MIKALPCLLLLTACKNYSGSTTVDSKISLLDGRKKIEIQPGTYEGALKIKSKTKVVLEMNLPTGKASFDFKTTQNLKELSERKPIRIPAGSSGQPYAVEGAYDMELDSTDHQRAVESCTYSVPEYRCHFVRDRHDRHDHRDHRDHRDDRDRDHRGHHGGRERCGYESVSYPGTQEVEYYYSSTTEKLILKLMDASQRVVATFKGTDYDSDKVYTFKSECR